MLFIGVTYGFAQTPEWVGLPVREIRFTGLKIGSPADFFSLLAIQENKPLTEADLNRSIKTLFGLDRFSNAEAFVTITPDRQGVIVNFSVEENIFIKAVSITGNRRVNKDDLFDVITISENSYLIPHRIDTSTNRILAKYADEGYINAKVSVKVNKLEDTDRRKTPDRDDEYEVLFDIVEGDRVVVEKIVINGNEEVPDRDIKGVLKTKEKVFIFQPGVLKKDEFREDRQRILMLYGQRGFLDSKVTRYEWKVESKPGRREGDIHNFITVYIDIEEGERYYMGKISFRGNTIFSTERLRPLVTLKENDIYDKMKIEQARMGIYNRYSDNGHLYANVSIVNTPSISTIAFEEIITNYVVNSVDGKAVTNLDIETITHERVETNAYKLDTEFVIYEGPRAHIENIVISGNTKTFTKVIERELLFDEGELYIQRKVRQSYERLMQLQYFKDVNFIPKPGSAEGLININIDVEEQRTGLITFGAGYGTESGLNLSAQISERNLFGTGRVIGLKGEYGERRQLIELSFQEPWLFNTPSFAGISLSYSRYRYDNIPTDDRGNNKIDGTDLNYIENPTESLVNYTSTNEYYKENISLGLNFRRRFGVYWFGSTSLSMNMYRDFGANFTTPLIYTTKWETNKSLMAALEKGFTYKYTWGLGAGMNSTDNPINPTRGGTFNLDLIYNGGIFGGDIHYIRPRASASYYWNPLWQFVFALHASTEFILPQHDGMPARYDTSDMLWFDGVYEMRGWQYYAKRGEAKVFYSGELRFQIIGQELWGLAFFDLGNLWAEYDMWSFNPNGYLSSFGIGIKINIPMLPIRLYLARRAEYDMKMQAWQLTSSQEFFDDWRVVFSIQGLF
jgi:outer membrane protein insertion porin family